MSQTIQNMNNESLIVIYQELQDQMMMGELKIEDYELYISAYLELKARGILI